MKYLMLIVFACVAQAQGPPPPKVTLNWTPSITTGVKQQMLFRGPGPGLEKYALPIVTFNENTTATYTDTDPLLTRGAQYCYTAEAFLVIPSVPSNEACVTIPLAPDSPSGLNANAQ